MGELLVTERVIRGPDCVLEGAEWLARTDPHFRWVTDAPLPLRLKPTGFAALLQAIVGQQVSIASAAAIWGRVTDAGFDQPAAILAASDADLRAVGLSRPKVRYARALAGARLDFDALGDLPSEQVIETLIAVPGIGRWTAEIYTKFSLGRADVFAAGDLALQEAARDLLGLAARPTEAEMRQIALAWSPWRSVAARALWVHYRRLKNREGVA